MDMSIRPYLEYTGEYIYEYPAKHITAPVCQALEQISGGLLPPLSMGCPLSRHQPLAWPRHSNATFLARFVFASLLCQQCEPSNPLV